ncbi:RING finger protein 151-like [Sycon ciliatum]|uniref:RING finger protein 151-like n=1 Tax=Sycon ciliatum TaxID=27933 RepID=UPI0031F68A60
MAEYPEQAAALAAAEEALEAALALIARTTEEVELIAEATAALINKKKKAAENAPYPDEYTAMVTWPSNNMGGFDKEAFITPPAPELTCPVCRGVLRHPMRVVRCGHHFCHSCITEVLRRKEQCPMDRGSLSWNVLGDSNMQLEVDGSVKGRIGELLIMCERKVDGCTWTGPLSSYNAHVTRDHS